MNVERLRKIIAYSDKNHEEIYSMVRRFCSFAGIEYDSDLLNILLQKIFYRWEKIQ